MASLADITGVVSLADLAEVAPSADLAGVASSADLAGLFTSRGTFRIECGDSVLTPGDCDYVCDEFAEVASLADHAGGVPVGMAPPADTDSTVAAGMSCVDHCPDVGGSPKSVGLLLADKNSSFSEQEVIVVGAVGTGAPWFLARWAEGTEVEFMIDTGCQVTILAAGVAS